MKRCDLFFRFRCCCVFFYTLLKKKRAQQPYNKRKRIDTMPVLVPFDNPSSKIRGVHCTRPNEKPFALVLYIGWFEFSMQFQLMNAKPHHISNTFEKLKLNPNNTLIQMLTQNEMKRYKFIIFAACALLSGSIYNTIQYYTYFSI